MLSTVPVGPCVCCATGIYQEPRERLATQVPAHAEEAGSADAVPEVQWRYKWTADGEVYGPFSSDQMAAWAEQVRVHFSPWAHCIVLSPPHSHDAQSGFLASAPFAEPVWPRWRPGAKSRARQGARRLLPV